MTLFRNFFSLFNSIPKAHRLLPQRTYGKKIFDKEKYLGKGFEELLTDFPKANILLASFDRRDPIQVEIKVKGSILTMLFNHFICDAVECFTDSPELANKHFLSLYNKQLFA